MCTKDQQGLLSLYANHITDMTDKIVLPTNLTLGKSVDYVDTYAPELLQAVPRSLNREQIGLGTELPFGGADRWTGYEVSWLNPKGKPLVAILECDLPCDSPNLIESKSFKLYLNSFNQTRLPSVDQMYQRLSNDLSQCAGKLVNVNLILSDQFDQLTLSRWQGQCIDDLDIEVNSYDIQPELLSTSDQLVSECLFSHLLKSNCLITNQPDWGSVQISYQGKQINHAALLKYLISFRQHNEFHEQCVERIFMDITRHCQPEKLSVYARYTRRGGLDINPFRSNFESLPANTRLARQ